MLVLDDVVVVVVVVVVVRFFLGDDPLGLVFVVESIISEAGPLQSRSQFILRSVYLILGLIYRAVCKLLMEDDVKAVGGS